jgi:hypothetical protein
MGSPEDAEFIDFGDEDNEMHITNKGVSLVELEQVFSFRAQQETRNQRPVFDGRSNEREPANNRCGTL